MAHGWVKQSYYSHFGAVGSQNLGFFLTLRDSDLHILSNRVTLHLHLRPWTDVIHIWSSNDTHLLLCENRSEIYFVLGSLLVGKADLFA